MNSSWDKTVAKSKYHFNTQKFDRHFDTMIHLGNLKSDFSNTVKTAIENSVSATWATRGYKGKENAIPSTDLVEEEYDLERIGVNKDLKISNLNWQLDEKLQKISDLFGLKDCMNRVHVQLPGQVWNLHIDKLEKWCPEDPDSVMRIVIQLTDWQLGHFYSMGNYQYTGWSSGHVTTFRWRDVPHCTANAGHTPRVTFQLTGVITDQTRKFLRVLSYSDYYEI